MQTWTKKTFERKVTEAAAEYMARRLSMKPQAINDFIVKNNLDAQAIAQDFERKFNHQDLAVAIVGYPDNQYSLNLIAHYKK